MFTLFRYARLKPNGFVRRLSKYSFGAYLCHPLFLEQAKALFGLSTLSFAPPLSVPVLAAGTAVLAFSFSAVLNRIPFVKKYFV